jgi:hypothetical protein
MRVRGWVRQLQAWVLALWLASLGTPVVLGLAQGLDASPGAAGARPTDQLHPLIDPGDHPSLTERYM